MTEKPRNHKTRKPLPITKELALAAINGSGGIVLNISKKLKCDWHTANKYAHKWPETVAAMEAEREIFLDEAECTIRKAVKGGDTGDAKWLLKNLGKKRGFVERQEVTGADGADLPITITVNPVKS